jgi:hypothetical protein
MAVGEETVNKGVEELIKTTTALGNTTIDLGRKNLTEIPHEILELSQLEVHFGAFSDFYQQLSRWSLSYLSRLIFYHFDGNYC